MGAFTKIFQRLRLTSDSNVATQTTAVIQADTTNSSIAIVPNGTGAIIASIPDGTATGGNARGNYAVDLQMSRTAANQVASNQLSSILGGERNVASGGYSVVIGGRLNQSTGTSSVTGGDQQTASAPYSVAIGGNANTASSNYSTISGGQGNSTFNNTHATVVGGQSNTSSGQHSVSGGLSNSAGGSRAVCFGRSNVASGFQSIALGEYNSVSANYGFGIGSDCKAYLYGQFASAVGPISVNGDAQQSLLTSRRSASLTTGATTVLSLDGSGTTNLIVPDGNNRAWNVQIDTIAVVTAITGTATGVSVGDCYRETKQLLFKRVGGTSSIVGTVDTTSIKSDTSMSTAALTVTAGASQQMALTFTAPTFAGGGSVTCRVVSKVSLVEVAY